MSFKLVGNELNKWTDKVRGTRGQAIGDVTIETINEIANCLQLPVGFTSYIDEYRKTEGALQSIADYRDHFIHPFHVFCLGYVILNKWRSEAKGQKLLDCIDTDKNFILKEWFVASIYHDVGYPSEKFEFLVKNFFKIGVGREIKSQFDWSSVLLADENIEHIRELSELFGNKAKDQSKTKTKKFEKWLYKRLIEDHDHGVLSALMLLNKDKIKWQTNDDIKLANEAALAIAIHNWRRRTNIDCTRVQDFELDQLQMEKFPLAFFLSYCDTAQEWGRKVLLEITTPNISMLDSILSNVEVSSNITNVTIKYQSRSEEIISENRTLRQVFDDVGNKFKLTWSRNSSSLNPMIAGIDVNDIPIGGFGPQLI